MLNHAWECNKLEIAQPCASSVGLLISAIPQIQELPELTELHALGERQPVDAVIQLVDEFVVPRGLWERFLEVLQVVGLKLLIERFFEKALRGTCCAAEFLLSGCRS